MSAPDIIVPVHEPSARSDAACATAVDTSLADGALLSRQRRPAPGELVSLWDMLRVDAAAFIRLIELLTRYDAVLRSMAVHFPGALDLNACEQAWGGVAPLLGEMEPICDDMELKYSVSSIRRLRDQFEGKVFELSALRVGINNLYDITRDQLTLQRYASHLQTGNVAVLPRGRALFQCLAVVGCQHRAARLATGCWVA